MKITYLEQERVFHLKTPEMSYAFGVAPDGRLLHLYWGQPLSQDASLACMMQDAPLSQDASVTYITQEAAKAQKKLRPLGHNIDRFGNTDRYEVPTREPADYTEPLLQVIHPDGVRSLRLIYESHKIEENHLVVFARDAETRVFPATSSITWA